MTGSVKKAEIKLSDDQCFSFLGGLWKGKKPPFIKAGVIRNTNFGNDGKIDFSDVVILDVEQKQLEKRRLLPGDIIIERSGGGPKQPVGRVVIFDECAEDKDYSFSNFTSVIRIKEPCRLLSKFALYFLLNFYLEGKTDQLQRRTTGIRNLDFDAYKDSVIFPSASLDEQKVVIRVLQSIQSAITRQEELISKLKELKRSMMQRLFTHGTKGEKTKMTEIGEIPESWEVVELSTVCEKPQYGFTASAATKGNVKFLRITDITEDGVDWNTVPFCKCDEAEKFLLEDRDIVFARIGATTGKSFLLRHPDNAVYASYLIRVRARDVQSEFLYYFFQTDAYWRQINARKGSSLKGGVNGSILSKLLIPKCSDGEQAQIARSFDAIEHKILVKQQKLSDYQNVFKTLLHELMSGERRVTI